MTAAWVPEMNTPIYKCWTKATDRESGPPRRSHSWATSQRRWFKIFDDRVECGDWRILFRDVRKATGYRTRSLFMPVTVLELQTGERTYQFGFNPWAKPVEHLPIEVEEKRVRLRYSPLSVMVRVAVLMYLAYLLWGWLT